MYLPSRTLDYFKNASKIKNIREYLIMKKYEEATKYQTYREKVLVSMNAILQKLRIY